MDNHTPPVDWSLIPVLLAVSDCGSLSAAARELKLSQPTLGRHIRAAEVALGGRLFDRHPRGLTPTALMQSLLPMAREMEAISRRMALQVVGEGDAASGTVRLTASQVVSVYLLPPILARIRAAYPEISIELVPSDTTQNLLFHEADIAIRMYRPTQLETLTRHLGDLQIGIYAAQSYAARRGLPDRLERLLDHDLIGYDRDERLIKGFREAGLPVTRDDFAVRCDDQVAYWELVRAGVGIGVGQSAMVSQTRGLVPVLPGASLPKLPVWLTAHERIRHVPRVDRIWNALIDGLAPALS